MPHLGCLPVQGLQIPIDLPLDSVEQIPVYQLRTRQVDRPVDYPGLPTNDVDATIPAYADFTVTSGDGPDTTTTKTLALSDVEFEVTATDDLGLPRIVHGPCQLPRHRGLPRDDRLHRHRPLQGDRDGEGQAHGAGRYLLPRGSRACTRT